MVWFIYVCLFLFELHRHGLNGLEEVLYQGECGGLIFRLGPVGGDDD